MAHGCGCGGDSCASYAAARGRLPARIEVESFNMLALYSRSPSSLARCVHARALWRSYVGDSQSGATTMSAARRLSGHRRVTRVMTNGAWDLTHPGHYNAWLQARAVAERKVGGPVELVVAIHDGAHTAQVKGRELVFSDEERATLARVCGWVDDVVTHVPYDIIRTDLLDEHGCAFVLHGDDMIDLGPDSPHMYSETDAAGRFLLFPRTPGISTTDMRARAAAGTPAEGSTAAGSASFPTAAGLVASFRARKQPRTADALVTYASGVFDMYSAGAAQELADVKRQMTSVVDDGTPYLIVGVQRDPSAVSPLMQRALSVLAHGAVDEVIIGAPQNPSDAWLEEYGVDGVVEGSRFDSHAADVLQRIAALEAAAAGGKGGAGRAGFRASGLPRFPSSVVGSLPRPGFVQDLVFGDDADDDPLYEKKLRAAILSAVALQLQAGCDVVTDGEWGRRSYIGVIAQMASGFELGMADDGRPMTAVVGKVHTTDANVLAEEAIRLQGILAELGVPRQPFKITLPAPALLGERMWYADKSASAYPTREAFVRDCVPVLRDALAALAALPGSSAFHVQVDDPHLCLFAVHEVRETYDDPEAAAAFSVDMVNAVIDGFEDSFASLAIHLCRRAGGRARGEHAFDGSLGNIAQHINNLNVDHLTLECTHEDDLAVLNKLRDDFEIGLGCVTVDPQHIDDADTISQRVRAALAAGLHPDRIVLNPDCGFAPGAGAKVDLDEVYLKLSNQAAAARALRGD